MRRSSSPAGERGPDDIVDDYLAQRYGVGLETVLLDAVTGHATSQTAGMVIVEALPSSRYPYPDGGVTEHFAGTLMIEGVTYEFRCTTYSIPDAYVAPFLTDLSHFQPVEWTARAQVGDARA